MPIFTMLVGLPGSGKSTYAKNLNGIIISSDEYRLKLLSDENNQENNSLIFETMFADTVTLLSSGHNVIYDATNINYKRRRLLVTDLKK